MKKFTTLTTNDDVKKAVKKAAHMLGLAAAEKAARDANDAGANSLMASYNSVLNACMDAKKNKNDNELKEKRQELKKIEEAVNEARNASQLSKYLIEGYKYAARASYAAAAVELVNLNAQYINGAKAGYKNVNRVTMAIEEALGGTVVNGRCGDYVDGPTRVSISAGPWGNEVYLYVSLTGDQRRGGYQFRLFDWKQQDTAVINFANIEFPEKAPTVAQVRAAAKKMIPLKKQLRNECDAFKARIQKLYEPCSMFLDAQDAYNDACAARL